MFVPHFLQVGDFDEAEFGVQGDAPRLIGINATEDRVMADFFGEREEFAEKKGAKAFALMFMVQIHRVLHAVAVGLARMKAAERAPADDDSTLLGHDYRMLRAVRVKPVPPFLGSAGHGLIGAGAVLHVVVVNGVDGREVGERGGAESGGHEGEVVCSWWKGSAQMTNVEIRMTNAESWCLRALFSNLDSGAGNLHSRGPQVKFTNHLTNTFIMAIKVGVIGAGGMLQYHAAGFRQAGAEIVAVADAAPGAAAKAAEKYGIAKSYESVEAMLKGSPEIKAVSVIVPNKFHKPLTIQCLKAGKHVFSEKPPALNAKEVKEIIVAAKKAGKKVLFNFNNRARPESQAMMKYINDGVVGKINSAQAKWIRRTGIPGFGGWFTTKDLSGGGPLIDLLHMVDLAMYFMGYPEPAHVLGQTFSDFIQDKQFKGPWGIPDRVGGTTDVENAAHGFVTFKTGQVLSLQVSWAEMVKREEVSVVFQGTKAGGKVERLFGIDGLDNTAIDTCELYVQENGNSVNRSIVTPACEDMGRIGSAANFIEAIEGKATALNTPEQALRLMQVIDAIYASAKTKKPVSI
jgi:predicted dehydrogenase